MFRRPSFATVLIVVTVGAFQIVPNTAHADGVDVRPFAGTGAAGFAGDGGPAAKAVFTQLGGIAVARDGTVFLSDTGNDRVRAVSPAGVVTTVAGTGREAPDPKLSGKPPVMPDGQRATEVDLSAPRDLAVAPDGTLYIVDELSRVLAMAPDGRMSVLAGTGTPGYSGDGGPARQAALNKPVGVAAARDGTVYIGDTSNHRLRAVSPAGIITTVAGNGDPDEDLKGPSAGAATEIPLPAASQPTIDSRGDVWVDSGGPYRLSGGRLAMVLQPDRDRWDLAKAGPSDDQLLKSPNTLTSIAGGRDGVYAFAPYGSERVLLRFVTGGKRSVDTLAKDQDLEGVGDSVTLAVGPGEDVYLADFEQYRVWVFHPPAPRPHRSWSWWWWLLAGGALGGVIWFIRRRVSRARRPRTTG